MKKEHFVNPEVVFAIFVLAALALSSCGSGAEPAQTSGSPGNISVFAGQWVVEYDPGDFSRGVFNAFMTNEEPLPVDSLHFQDPELADSLVFRRAWAQGGGSFLIFSVTVPAFQDTSAARRIWSILEGSSAIHPQGLRAVYLSDRSFSEIDEERASPSVEPPPEVNHHLVVTYDPTNQDSCLHIRDSLVVDFTVSNSDSMIFSLDQGEGERNFTLYPDSMGKCSRVFEGVLGINRLYTDHLGNVTGHARLTSAYLTGQGFFPLSDATQNYTAEFILPDSIYAWTPLREVSNDLWQSAPGGITGGLPLALGNYSTYETGFGGYTKALLSGGIPDSLDSQVISTSAAVLSNTLSFASAGFAFIEIQNPDGDMVCPVFGGVFFSRGSLESLADVSDWDERISTAEVPEGCRILTSFAEGLLMQSLRLDPVLEDMLISWLPLRYYAFVEGDPEGIITLREGYMKYYLYSTEMISLNGNPEYRTEYSIADPRLADSPLRPFIAGGKGVILLEFMHSRGLLVKLPDLLQGFTHSWSSNYWPRIYSTLLFNDKLSDQYRDLLRKLFYLPGIPQITVEWREDKGIVYMEPFEIQPGIPFNLPMDSIPCLLHLQDTVFVREAYLQNGLLQCEINLPEGEAGMVTAIDLNGERVLPADFMYRRYGIL